MFRSRLDITRAARGAVVGLLFVGACKSGTEPKNKACGSVAPLSLAPGEVRVGINGTSVCAAGGPAGAEYALVPFNSSVTYATVATVNFTAKSAAAIPVLTLSRTSGTGSLLQASAQELPQLMAVRPSFEARLRRSEQRFLAPRMAAARAWYRNQLARGGTNSRFGTSRSIAGAPPAIGDLITLNTKTGDTFDDACTTPDNRTGRVAAISSTAIIVADTANPVGGYSDDEYLQIGQKFDTVFTVDTNAFSGPTDIDGNGKVIIFFTRAVNEMTPHGSDSFVGGFFYGRDLFPKQDTPELGPGSGCATSNFAEMFYVIVPDPNGVVNGNVRAKDFVQRIALSTTAHEFQHLINAARRLYVNVEATSFEIEWLNEGLSHVAEELYFYNQSDHLSPRLDIDSLRFRGNQKNVDAYNFNQSSNFGRLREYLAKPSSNSPYASNDSLETRGATWSFLRYAADHRGTSDGDTWRKLVNSTTFGMANLRNVFGTDLTSIFRDWATATIADDIAGVGAQWQQPSWHFKSVYHYIPSIHSYPLATVTVGETTPVSVSLNGGGVAYVRFTIAANESGLVEWTTPSTDVQFSLVRLK